MLAKAVFIISIIGIIFSMIPKISIYWKASLISIFIFVDIILVSLIKSHLEIYEQGGSE